MFENDNPEDREELIRRLIARGLPAFELNSGGDIIHVVVPLVQSSETGFEVNAGSIELISEINSILANNPSDPHLFIATNSLRTSCEIGLIGEDAYGNLVSTDDWEFAPEIGDAELIIERLWENRDNWLRKWMSNEIGNA